MDLAGKASRRRFSERLERTREVVERWGLAALAFLLAGALFTIHVIHVTVPKWGEEALPALGIVVALGIAYQILNIARDTGKLTEEIGDSRREIGEVRQEAESGLIRLDSRLADLTQNIDVFRREAEGNLLRLAQNLSPDLSQLSDIFKDLKTDAESLYPIETLEMDWLGIDMVHAWSHIVKEFLANSQIKTITLRLLMISPQWTHDPPWLPVEVRDWRENSPKSLARINIWMSNELSLVQAQGRNINLQIKLYDRLPVAHGFYIKKPTRTCYMSFFRWEGANYWQYGWGQDKYWKIVGDDLPPALRDLLEIFVGQFEYLWRSAAAHVPSS